MHATLSATRSKLGEEIDRLSPNQLLPQDDSTVCEHFIQKHRIEPLILHEEALHQHEPKEVEVEERSRDFGNTYIRKHLHFTFELPFSGTAGLFDICPASQDYNPPRAEVVGRSVVIRIATTDHDAQRVRQELDRRLIALKRYVAWQEPDIAAWNDQLPEFVRQRVAARRQKLMADRMLTEAIGVPVKRRTDLVATSSFPLERKRIVPPSLPPNHGANASGPEAVLGSEIYEDIIDTLADMSLVMERCPSAFYGQNEESLRMQFLIPLNGTFTGQASGETFNGSGKTDIMIKHEGRILFVAECKFWKGPKSLHDTIDQLLGYLTYRETKAAILLFNRGRDFSALLSKVPETAQSHPQFVRMEKYDRSPGFRCILRHPRDTGRFTTVTILAFDVPQEPPAA